MNIPFKSLWLATACIATFAHSYAQEKDNKHPQNWFNMDLQKDGELGLSTDKAYTELLKNKKPKQKILVAIIDSGVDTAHEDLKSKIWTNPKEITNNGTDDDQSGHADDIHGWSFLGSAKGNLEHENLEMVRLIRYYKPKFESTTSDADLDSTEKVEFKLYKKLMEAYGKDYAKYYPYMGVYEKLNKQMEKMEASYNTKKITETQFNSYEPKDEEETTLYKKMKQVASRGSFEDFYQDLKDGYKEISGKIDFNLNMQYDGRQEWVSDDANSETESNYGNNDVKGPDAMHGTHLAGIIGADRNNTLGMKGVADNIEIMSIRTVPDGDERDKDVANAIRYATNMGARVLNMSFGKSYKWDKKVVDEAVKYAEEKGVLIVHAAGNDNQNNDLTNNYPSKYFDIQKGEHHLPELNDTADSDSTKLSHPAASNWIEVGASDDKNDENLKASFSNYGKKSVDVFAPGVKIYSTTPENTYQKLDGTSMACPVVTGLSALILSYYPQLSPKDVRDIIMKSVTKITQKVKLTVDDKTQKVPFTDLCVTGGVVNAYNALKLAEKYKPSKK